MASGAMIRFSKDNQYEGYLSAPAGGGPGVLVLQEWWGLVEHIKDVCDRLAAAGYAALAPDLYEGQSTESPDEAGRMMMALDIERTARILVEAGEFLLAQPACTSAAIGVVGFCMGGQLALYGATQSPKIAACVDFYGIHPAVEPPVERLSGPVLGLFGSEDSFVPLDAARALEARLLTAGKQAEFYIYAGAGHAFFNDSRPTYHQEAATDAWQKVLAFLGQHVR